MFMNCHLRKQNLAVILVILFVLMFPCDTFPADPNELSESVSYFDMDIEDLMNVEVTVASKKSEPQYEAPGVVVVVPREEFIVYGDRNLRQLLQRQPSVYTRDTFQYTDNVAGFRGDMSVASDIHTLILFNGRPIRESGQGLYVNVYKTFPLSVLGSVELIRGPGSVLYGSNACTGVINLMPRIPDTNEVSISTMFGSHDYYSTDITAGGRSGELGYITAVRVAGEQGYPYNMTDMFGVYREDDRNCKSHSGVAHLEHGNFTFDGFWSDYDAFALGVIPSWSNTHHIIRNKRLFLNAGYRIPFHERLALEFNLTYNLQENFLSSYRPQLVQTNTSDFLGELTLYAKPMKNLNLMEQRSNYHSDSDKFQSIPPYRHEPKSFYFQCDYMFGEVVKLISGIQWNKSGQGVADLLSRYGIIINPNDRWGIKLLRGEAFHAPEALVTEVYDPPALVGNRSIEPEGVTTYDAQLFYHDEKTYAAVTYFQSTIDNIFTYDASVVPGKYINGGKQRFKGIEFEAKRSLTPNWQLLGSFMHQENKEEAGVGPTVVPENMLKVGTSYTGSWGSLGVFLTHFGEPPHIFDFPVVNPKPEAVSLISMNLQLDVSEWLSLKKGQSHFTFKVENLLDEEIYVPTFAYTGSPNSFPYGPGMTFYTGLTVKN
jgi:outer membrane receptor for ferrienterochelin and colicins